MTPFPTARGFKVTDGDRKLRVGIATRSLVDLRQKTMEKFKLKAADDDIYFQTQDGTLIDSDDYLATLPAQSVLVWVRRGEKAPTDAEILYKTIREVNDEFLTAGEKVQQFFTEQMKTKVFKLAQVLKGIDNNNDQTKASLKCQHPEWFEGLDTTAKTKEDYMFRRAQDRIRTYLYKTKDELLSKRTNSNDAITTMCIRTLLSDLTARLKKARYNGALFDRRLAGADDGCLCNANGDFYCQGRWDKNNCLYNPPHSINPYASRESRIIFQIWNLDHGVERTRAVIPAILDALTAVSRVGDVISDDRSERKKSDKTPRLDAKAIYADLFTLENLKFVHVVCHDKGAHSTKKAGPYLLYY